MSGTSGLRINIDGFIGWSARGRENRETNREKTNENRENAQKIIHKLKTGNLFLIKQNDLKGVLNNER